MEKVVDFFSIRQLSFTLLALLFFIALLSIKNINKTEQYQNTHYSVDSLSKLSELKGKIIPVQECPFSNKDTKRWDWCHNDDQYRVCKANFEYSNKTADLLMIIQRIGSLVE